VLGLTEVTGSTCSTCYFGVKQLCSLQIEGDSCPTFRVATEAGPAQVRPERELRFSSVDHQRSQTA
jgi:hypothetical protein